MSPEHTNEFQRGARSASFLATESTVNSRLLTLDGTRLPHDPSGALTSKRNRPLAAHFWSPSHLSIEQPPIGPYLRNESFSHHAGTA